MRETAIDEDEAKVVAITIFFKQRSTIDVKLLLEVHANSQIEKVKQTILNSNTAFLVNFYHMILQMNSSSRQ
jgi:hypothetical protein